MNDCADNHNSALFLSRAEHIFHLPRTLSHYLADVDLLGGLAQILQRQASASIFYSVPPLSLLALPHRVLNPDEATILKEAFCDLFLRLFHSAWPLRHDFNGTVKLVSEMTGFSVACRVSEAAVEPSLNPRLGVENVEDFYCHRHAIFSQKINNVENVEA